MEPQRDPILYGLDSKTRNELPRPGYLRLEETVEPGYHTISKRAFHEGREYSVKFYFPRDQIKAEDIQNPEKNLEIRILFKKLISEMLEIAETMKLGDDENVNRLRLQERQEETEDGRKQTVTYLLHYNKKGVYTETKLLDAVVAEKAKAESQNDEARAERLEYLRLEVIKTMETWRSHQEEKADHNQNFGKFIDENEFGFIDSSVDEAKLAQLKSQVKVDLNYKNDKEKERKEKLKKWQEEAFMVAERSLAESAKKQERPKGQPAGEIIYLAPVYKDIPEHEIETESDFVKDFTPPPPKGLGDRLISIFKREEKPAAVAREPKPQPTKFKAASVAKAKINESSPVASPRGKKPAPPARPPEAEDAEEPAAAPPPPPPKKAGAKAPPPPPGAKAPPPPPRESPKPAGKAPPPPPPPPKAAAVASAPPALDSKPAAASAPSSPPPAEDEDVELQGSGQESGEDNAKKPTAAEQNQAPAEAPAAAEASAPAEAPAAAEDNPMAAQLKLLRKVPKAEGQSKGKTKSTDPLLNALGSAMESRRGALAPKSETEGDDEKKKNKGKQS